MLLNRLFIIFTFYSIVDTFYSVVDTFYSVVDTIYFIRMDRKRFKTLSNKYTYATTSDCKSRIVCYMCVHRCSVCGNRIRFIYHCQGNKHYIFLQTVEELGGMEFLTKERRWQMVAVRMGYPSTRGLGGTLKHHYERILYPFYLFKKGETVRRIPEVSKEICKS